ncbi:MULTISPECIES: PH domain-containing protein [unclassified Gordonia (in: high G+C Gram-positive bacteria)]|uniref:PH domain-containing protein n=1 Tax=unclassified Gordonia (in: high G+C Gram-positive bacteria) TaxID=2657482 RepID=UPI001FFFC6F5|nr:MULTISPECIES: PH domain-containing protein [unclassified Gordonia (in: high G+C Gram-positive bacteria)]UQE73945.1 PH domain-containing protein [Gordonia sp. PP30]
MPDPASARATTAADTATFAISRLAYLTILVTILLAIMMMGVSVAGFGWMLALPVLQIWWIHRIKTVADRDGLTAVHTVGTSRLEWSEIDGLRFPKWGAARAVRPDGSAVRLPAVTFDDLPVLSKISGGALPDPFAAEREARLAAQD